MMPRKAACGDLHWQRRLRAKLHTLSINATLRANKGRASARGIQRNAHSPRDQVASRPSSDAFARGSPPSERKYCPPCSMLSGMKSLLSRRHRSCSWAYPRPSTSLLNSAAVMTDHLRLCKVSLVLVHCLARCLGCSFRLRSEIGRHKLVESIACITHPRELKFQRFILVRIVLHVEDLRNLHHGLLCRQVREVELLKSGFCRILGFANCSGKEAMRES
mmetsp:Transcript_5117/g.15604  ORF Transcript_5117/g.15604 Transcript_5117/m.15604 type:complete len:219 (+) Transcript_5117:233-889(+)